MSVTPLTLQQYLNIWKQNHLEVSNLFYEKVIRTRIFSRIHHSTYTYVELNHSKNARPST